ncbi:MAG: aminoglycoside phosphotransferase family protein [Dechloromonas sp.]|nr:aminoglycoside phosphotransferase family protein [Dechloromonas sp.]
MVSNHHSPELFAFVAAAHPFYPVVEQLRAMVRTATEFHDFPALAGTDACDVHAEIKAQRAGDGGWRLQRAYWSLQRKPADGRQSFRADTAYYKDSDGGCSQHALASDPYLTTAAGYLERNAEVEVLRYVPLRRLTFRTRAGAGFPAACIGKLKRMTKIRESYARLAAVHRAANAARASFAVAAPLHFDAANCVFYQQALAGHGYVADIDPANLVERMRQLGELHAELHDLPVAGMPSWDLGAYWAMIRADVEWIALFRPDCAAVLQGVLPGMERSAPVSPAGSHVFCHGDFVASQLLVDGRRLAVTDFDTARRGDAYQEIAKLLASIKYDVPLLRAPFYAGKPIDRPELGAAEAAYLRGYAAVSARRIDRDRLRWFRICAEIHYLALALRKDAYHAAAFECAVAYVAASAQRLQGSRA